MIMGTTRSLWRYDALASQALQRANLRLPAILCYASRVAVFPILQGSRVTFDSSPLDQIPGSTPWAQ